MYVCYDVSCPNYEENNNYYCMLCLPIKHLHTTFQIAYEVDKVHSKWLTLKENIQTNIEKVKISYDELKPLILYFE